jgi:hypothetical protein
MDLKGGKPFSDFRDSSTKLAGSWSGLEADPGAEDLSWNIFSTFNGRGGDTKFTTTPNVFSHKWRILLNTFAVPERDSMI